MVHAQVNAQPTELYPASEFTESVFLKDRCYIHVVTHIWDKNNNNNKTKNTNDKQYRCVHIKVVCFCFISGYTTNRNYLYWMSWSIRTCHVTCDHTSKRELSFFMSALSECSRPMGVELS